MITNREGADARETHSEGGSFASEDIPAIIRVNPILNWNLSCAHLGLFLPVTFPHSLLADVC